MVENAQLLWQTETQAALQCEIRLSKLDHRRIDRLEPIVTRYGPRLLQQPSSSSLRKTGGPWRPREAAQEVAAVATADERGLRDAQRALHDVAYSPGEPACERRRTFGDSGD